MISGIGIRNYRSFDDDGIFLENLSKVNIIIGKNNCGKSNILRFFKLLYTHVNDFHKLAFLDPIDNFSTDNLLHVGFSLTHEELDWPAEIYLDNVRGTKSLSEIIGNPFKIWLSSRDERIQYLPKVIADLETGHLKPLAKSNNYVKDSLLQNIANDIDRRIKEKIKTFRNLIDVPDLRVINPSSSHNCGNSEINGANIIDKLFHMQHPEVGKEEQRKVFEKIQSFVKDLLNADELVVEVTSEKKSILITMHGKRLPLQNYGSGVYQIILLCAALVMYEKKIICIEEPGTHLHPELQRKFLDFIINKTDNTYFITTHSSTLVNHSENISVYHVQHDGVKSTLNKIENTKASYRILDDLGYKASDLIQSNGIIWVEGPSDRHFLIKWISLLDPSLKEGLHFTIMFYGGKNLANVCFTNDSPIDDGFSNDLIHLLKVNRNAVVVIDSDVVGRRTQINATKSRIQLEIGNDNCWITKGKEIENYINASVIEKWLKSINAYNDKLIKVDSNELFDDVIRNFDKTEKICYSLKKTTYSKQIAMFFELEDLEIMDLQYQMKKIIRQIHIWNHKN